MKLSKMIESIDPIIRIDAEELLKAKNFYSLLKTGKEYEALIFFEDGPLLPLVVMDRKQRILGYECQCDEGGYYDICVHMAATLLGIERMVRGGCLNHYEIMGIPEAWA